jgi:hypothetical protein
VISAANLFQTDPFGTSNPYITVEWHGKILGKSRVFINTLNPQINERFVFRTYSDERLEDMLLRVHVWDQRILTSSGDFLGCISFTGERLVSLLEGEAGLGVELPLRPNADFNEEVRVRNRVNVRERVSVTEMVKVRVRVRVSVRARVRVKVSFRNLSLLTPEP